MRSAMLLAKRNASQLGPPTNFGQALTAGPQEDSGGFSRTTATASIHMYSCTCATTALGDHKRRKVPPLAAKGREAGSKSCEKQNQALL